MPMKRHPQIHASRLQVVQLVVWHMVDNCMHAVSSTLWLELSQFIVSRFISTDLSMQDGYIYLL